MNMSSSYENAPLTLFLSVLTFIFTYVYLSSNQSYLSLDLKSVLQGELWRLITGQLAFANMSQLLVGSIMLYSCRLFERQMGTRKFAAFVVFCWVVTTLSIFVAAIISGALGFPLIPASGPFFIIFAYIALFYRYIPKVLGQQYLLFGLMVSEKSGIYFLAVQLLFSQGIGSIVMGLLGLFAGFLYDIDKFGFQRWRLPVFIEQTCGSIYTSVSFILPQTQRINNTAPRAAQMEPFGRSATMRTHAGDIPSPYQMPPPDEESIATLVNLGFERQVVIRALQSCGNNVDAAANMLLQ